MSHAPYDIVVVGGGITGAGIARDAALRGLRVALFEKGDFGSGTSSKSSKLIHGGLRYLEHAEIGLVFESVSERRVQMHVAPHLVRPQSFLVPVFENSRVGLELMNVGLWIYDTLALFRSPKLHKTVRGPDKVTTMEPSIRKSGLKGAIEYHDCFTDDSRLVLENILDAQKHGARCESYTEVSSIERKDGRVCAVSVRDKLSGSERRVATHSVIMATGPWSNRAIVDIGAQMKSTILSPTKGVHLVFPREKLPIQRAITVISHLDGRVMFAIPWRERIVLGTTDTYFEGDPDEVHATAEDAEYLCESANHYFPDASFRPEDALSSWAGLRPLIHEKAESASDVSREHQIYVNDDGVLLVAGGKLTTYRLMAKDTVKAAIRWLRQSCPDEYEGRKLVRPRTKKRPLPGGTGLADSSVQGVEALAAALSKEHSLPRDLCEHWAFTYGARTTEIAQLVAEDPRLTEPLQSDLSYTWAEIEYAIRCECVRTVEDILARRVPLLLLGREQGLDVVEKVAERLVAARGLDDKRRVQEIQRYRETVQKSRAGLRSTPARTRDQKASQ